MAEELAIVNVFSVSECGMYEWGKNDPEDSCALGISETFKALYQWIQKISSLSSEATNPYYSSHPDFDDAHCYMNDIYFDEPSGDYVLVLWKSDSHGANALWGFSGDDKYHSRRYQRIDKGFEGKNMIWGRPSYYWVCPSKGVVVSIKLKHSIADAKMFQEYVKGVINYKAENQFRRRPPRSNGNSRVELYAYGNDDKSYIYRFKMHQSRVSLDEVEIKKIQGRVEYVVLRDTVSIPDTDLRQNWVVISDQFMKKNPFSRKRNPRVKPCQVEMKVEQNPSLQQLRKYVQDSSPMASPWSKRVGFELKETKQVIWADSYSKKSKISFDIEEGCFLKAIDVWAVIESEREGIVSGFEMQAIGAAIPLCGAINDPSKDEEVIVNNV